MWSSRSAFLAVILAVPAFSSSVSFVGNFTHDNDVQLINFSVLADSTVTVQTWGFGGTGAGTNAAGNSIAAGGFASVLQIYTSPSGTAVGGPIQPGPDPVCAPRIPDPARTGACNDAFKSLFLPFGNYILSLTQSPNDPLGNLSDGFFYVDAVPFQDFNNGFNDPVTGQATSAWAVDITITPVQPATAPEPGSVFLSAAALLLVGISARRRRAKSAHESN